MSENFEKDRNMFFTSLACFQRIGVIGDSYASGWLDVSGEAKDWYSISWIQQLARMNGIEGVNISKGGLTTRSWLTDDMGLPRLNSEAPCGLYYIVLGINDVNLFGMDYLGTADDCTDDASKNPDTFYGNMGRIVAAVRARAPKAKIIFSTTSFTDGSFPAYNDAIVNAAKHFGCAYIVQNEDPFFTSGYYNNYKVGGHPSAQLYGGMARAIERLTDRCMVENAEYFNNIYPLD